MVVREGDVPKGQSKLRLYNLKDDIEEKNDLSGKNKRIAEQLSGFYRDRAQKVTGKKR